MKKNMSILLVLLLSLMLTVPVFAADTCFVAGIPELCGSSWQASDANNAMTLKGSIYEKVYSNVPVGDYQFKVVYNGQWKGNGNDNVLFSVTSPCDVTITYDPSTETVGYSGPGVVKTSFKVTNIYAVGAKSDLAPGWLNGENWNPAAVNNQTVLTADGVYSISFEDIPAGTYEFKFAADGAWTHSWGGTFTEFGVATDAAYNGNNISFTLTETAKVTLTLDLNNFDLSTGGAKFTVALNSEDPPPPPEVHYYVAGCQELCGTYWEANTPANQMTKGSDGIYTKTFNNVAQGTYQLKVTDGTWDNSWGGDGPEGNYEFTTEAGDVTVKFDSATKLISVDLPGKPAPEPAGPKYYVSGNCAALGDWNAAPAQCLMDNKGDGVYRITFKSLPAGNYEFKITDGTWNNSWGDNGGNYKFQLSETKQVTIIFKLNNGQYSIQVEQKAPGTGDFTMLPVFAAALCAAMGACMLVMNKKKLI